MCKLPKIAILAPEERHLELRKALSSLEYEIVATVQTPDEAAAVTADVVVAVDASPETIDALADLGAKLAVVGAGEADLVLDDVRDFKTRIWELFRPS